MARKNQETEIWSDLHQDFSIDGQGGLKKVTNLESVKTSINNILGTAQGERIFLPEFASNLRALLFNPIGSAILDNASNQVKDTIERWDSRVVVEGVNFIVNPDANYISITVKFYIKSLTEVFSHTVTLNG